MNLILFESAETGVPLPRTDPRAVHLMDVLRRKPGDTFDAGVTNGPRGKGTVVRVGEQFLELSFAWGPPPLPLEPLCLLVGLPRPQTARKILHEAAALGVTHVPVPEWRIQPFLSMGKPERARLRAEAVVRHQAAWVVEQARRAA